MVGVCRGKGGPLRLGFLVSVPREPEAEVESFGQIMPRLESSLVYAILRATGHGEGDGRE